MIGVKMQTLFKNKKIPKHKVDFKQNPKDAHTENQDCEVLENRN